MKIINRNIIYSFLIGISMGLILMNLFLPQKKPYMQNENDIIVSINDENLTVGQYYDSLKKNNGIQVLLDIIDNNILSKMYKDDELMLKTVNKQCYDNVNYYTSYYGKTEKDFYNSMNLNNREEYLDKLKLEYKRKLYYNEYLKSLIKQKDIINYYENYVFGDIKTKYIAISIDNPNADSLLNEILGKLNNGNTYDNIVNEYDNIITHEDLGYISYNQENYESYLNILLSLEDNSYSKSYVETYYGYTIIFREDQKEKITYDDAKNDIIKILINEMDKKDSKLYQRTLIELRKLKNINFNDEQIEKLYNEYCSNYY